MFQNVSLKGNSWSLQQMVKAQWKQGLQPEGKTGIVMLVPNIPDGRDSVIRG